MLFILQAVSIHPGALWHTTLLGHVPFLEKLGLGGGQA